MTTPTARQLQILRLLWDGLCRKQIAAEIGVSRKTVENHIARLRTSANVGTDIALVRYFGNGFMRKLTERQAVQILASKQSGSVLARRYGVSRASIWKIKAGRNWKHAKP